MAVLHMNTIWHCCWLLLDDNDLTSERKWFMNDNYSGECIALSVAECIICIIIHLQEIRVTILHESTNNPHNNYYLTSL